MKRRAILVFIVAAIVSISGLNGAVHAQGEPASLAQLGLNEFQVQVGDDGFQVPSSTPAGRTLIKVHNVGAESRHSFLVRLPDDLTIGGLFAGAGSDEAPPWLFQGLFPGYPSEVPAGEERDAVVDLSSGLYVLIDDFPAVFLVLPSEGDSTPAAVSEPLATEQVSLFEFGFQPSAPLASGPQVLKVVNVGRVPHELMILKAPDGFTKDQLGELVTFQDDTATPTGGGPSFAELTSVGGMSWLTQGQTAWTDLDLEPGTYALVCFAFDPDTGMTHAMEGMYDVITVS